MGAVSRNSRIALLLAMLTAPATVGLAAQPQDASEGDVMTTVYGTLPTEAEMTKGPEIEGIISARSGNRMQVTTADGANTVIAITDNTDQVKGASWASTATSSPPIRCSTGCR